MTILWNTFFPFVFSQASCFDLLILCCYTQIEMPPLSKSMDDDLAEAAKEVEVRIQTAINKYL